MVQKCLCGKEHIDLSKEEYWETQSLGQCWKHPVNMLKKYGVNGGANENPIIIASQNESNLVFKNLSIGVEYLYTQLELGHPIVVGVDDGRQAVYNSDRTTEHFILIVGCGCESSGPYFRYFDCGSKSVDFGANKTNLLFIVDKSIVGKSPNGKKIYTVAQIRRNK